MAGSNEPDEQLWTHSPPSAWNGSNVHFVDSSLASHLVFRAVGRPDKPSKWDSIRRGSDLVIAGDFEKLVVEKFTEGSVSYTDRNLSFRGGCGRSA